MLCRMTALKQHALFAFWIAALMEDSLLIENTKSETSMGHLELISIKDLLSEKKMIAYIKEAMLLNDNGIELPAK